MKKESLRVVILFAALAALCSCTKTGTVAGPGGRVNAWTQPHVLRFADAGDVNTLNPHLGQFADVGYLSSLTMAWLVKWDLHNRAYPELATQVPDQENGGVSKDGLTITYHIRRGVRWSDGAPFNADDGVFSFVNVCDTLGIDGEALRARLSHHKANCQPQIRRLSAAAAQSSFVR